MLLSIYKTQPQLVLRAVKKQTVREAHLLHAAHCLEVDVVSFAWSQRRVPKALIGPVVAHCEWGGFRKVPWGKFRGEIVGRTPALGVLVRDRDLVALHGSSFPLGSVWVQLLHNNLIGTFWKKKKNSTHLEILDVNTNLDTKTSGKK